VQRPLRRLTGRKAQAMTADLIIRALNGQHLNGFLPANDNQGAISHSVASKREWCGGGELGRVSGDGIGVWPSAAGWGTRRNASLFLTWPEVLEVIAAGCRDGHREAYEAAFRDWSAQVEASGPAGRWFADTTPLHQATEALIRHGAERTQVQEALF
jgi:hypothetical protein